LEKDEIDDFIASHGGEDCPEVLLKMAKGNWQKAVAIEFVRLHEKCNDMKKDLSWNRWLLIAMFGVIVLEFLSQVINGL
jgi:hypothetical protein